MRSFQSPLPGTDAINRISPHSLIFKGDCLCQWLLYLD
ncbi:hypothetical protein COO91_02705 [Nostoc flagelliforme CCNUN1]|uniref:Uncharacterized protein n=1 Tax=Nostoc flagelliforme CCNUN1 TaxID=2038116 RepID=A0A2K8SN44_9NOSO|nr:hypothetical protein COO91_02705 [Nostoc flagelliforme CCNUN1]